MTSRTCRSLPLRSLGALAVLAALLGAPAPAAAQIAAAIGRPLPVGSDPAGTVTVRVSNSDRSPAPGLDVTLEVGSAPRTSRTDAEGRATFAGVPAGAQAIVKISTEKGGDHASQPFTMPASGGVRLMMSTTGTFAGAGGGAAEQGGAGEGGGPAMGGGGQPSLRQRSGGVIANPGTPAATLAIRLSYDDPSDPSPPKDHPVYLVGYGPGEKIAVVHKNSDAEGRISFDGLDVSGATAYFAMTLLPRGQTFERLLAGPIVPPGGTGLAMVLSGEKRTSTAPGADDLFELLRQPGPVPAGQVVIELQGDPELGGKVALFDAETGTSLVEGTVAAPPAEAPGTDPEKAQQWPLATIDATAVAAGKLVYAESTMRGQRFRSLPFQLVPDRGARANLLVGPRVMMRFSLTSEIGEDYFAFRGRFMLANNSWFPYKHSEDGLTMPLPKGFTGAQVTDEDAPDISPVPGEGLRILRPLPPGGKNFLAGWSMSTSGGKVNWDLALPWGSAGSGMEIMQMPGTTVELPPGVEGRTVSVAKGAFFVLPEISILPNQRMVMTIRGLPTPPLWKLWAPRIVGGVVIVILLGGVAFAFLRGGARGAREQSEADKETLDRIDALMDELVALEGSPDEARRAEVMSQLEQLWPAAQPSDRKASA